MFEKDGNQGTHQAPVLKKTAQQAQHQAILTQPRSQAPGDGVAGGVKAREDEGADLGQQLLLGQGLA